MKTLSSRAIAAFPMRVREHGLFMDKVRRRF
jgi:hypothetical protein